MRFLFFRTSVPLLGSSLQTLWLRPGPAAAARDKEFGISAFERECTKCHGNTSVDKAPSPAAVRQMPPERIYAAITTGSMKDYATNLSDEQKRRSRNTWEAVRWEAVLGRRKPNAQSVRGRYSFRSIKSAGVEWMGRRYPQHAISKCGRRRTYHRADP